MRPPTSAGIEPAARTVELQTTFPAEPLHLDLALEAMTVHHPTSFAFDPADSLAGTILPPNPVDRGKLLLKRTRELIELRGKVAQAERECRAIIASLHEGPK